MGDRRSAMRFIELVVGVMPLVVAACGADDTLSLGAGSGGSSGTGGGPATTSIGSGGSGGTSSGSGGAGTGGEGGRGEGGATAASGTAGTSGDGGSGGSGGSGGTIEDAAPTAEASDGDIAKDVQSEAAAVLPSFRWELPCGPTVQDGRVCENYPPGTHACPQGGYTWIDKTVTFGGTPGTVHDVQIRFRGVVEPSGYTGGTSSGDGFYVGGKMVTNSDHNVFALSVSSPEQIYYPNEGTGGHYAFSIDYVKTIKIEGGATLRMTAFDSDCISGKNCQKDVTASCQAVIGPVAVAPYPAVYNGNFVQMDVVSVSP